MADADPPETTDEQEVEWLKQQFDEWTLWTRAVFGTLLKTTW